QTFGDGQRNVALDLGVAELRLGLALELRLEHLDADHRRQALAHILTGEVGVRLLEQPGLAGVAVEHVGQSGAEAGDVAAALDGVDGVGERDDVLDKRRVVLQRDLGLRALYFTFDIERRDVDHLLVPVQGAGKRPDSALEVEGLGDGDRLVYGGDLQPLVEVRHLAQAVADDLAVELRVREDLGIGPEADLGAIAVGLADRLDGSLGHAPRVLLEVGLTAQLDPDLQLLAQEVDG